MRIILATKNNKKKAEILQIFSGINQDFVIQTLNDYPDCPDVIEDGDTFEANAIKKAVQVSKFTGQIALADDSGLVVDVLDGKPGVYSARFAGENAITEQNNQKLLSMMQDYKSQDQRKAKFVCVMVLAKGDEILAVCRGECHGFIAQELRGTTGFGYDPLFITPEYSKTFAELGQEIKNKISHRASALSEVKKCLKSFQK